MPRIKADSGKSNKSPFCGRRKKRKPKTDNLFTDERKKSLAESDLGSYLQQDTQWPMLFQDKENPDIAGSCSRSEAKLNQSMESLNKRIGF
jgi:hypothetical protein